MTNEYIQIGNLKIAKILLDFVNQEVLPDININQDIFWSGVESILTELSPENHRLLQKRDYLQSQIDEWHRNNPGKHTDIDVYKKFLFDIGYLSPRNNNNENIQINTSNVDDEIAIQAAPQLVVPLTNARFTLNAANARWGSLYDALYGTDVISESDGCERTSKYNKKRGEKVINYTRQCLDQSIPLMNNLSHTNVIKYSIENKELKIILQDGTITQLQYPNQFIGYQGNINKPNAILFIHHGLHIEIVFDENNNQNDMVSIKDILIESALTTILDCEDSVAVVDAYDKVKLYRNWLGLMKGDLKVEFIKKNEIIHRKLNTDRIYITKTGNELRLSGRSLLFIRHVGHLMYTDAILNNNQEIPEGILDACITTLIALYDINTKDKEKIKNSQKGSIYIVKPKQHGPEEVAFTSQLFSRIEDFLKLPRYTLKIGIMDEERRTTVNLISCIQQVKERLVFINTGFLDRTGDEIHTSMEAGPLLRKEQMKEAKWLIAYEKNNVEIGLKCGLSGKAQIGKGMWAMPDMMTLMMQQKINHIKTGATCAWVPSPTAATLHALHYHQIDVFARQKELISLSNDYLNDLLTIPILNTTLTTDEIQHELNNNAQSILGYVVRWIDQGIGCSKVPDINNIGLMEDRATLRISSQLMANWLRHGIITKQQVIETLQRMAYIVDQQNANDVQYRPMVPNFDQNIAFQAALDLILDGHKQPNGYTELILHRRRREFKAQKSIK